MSYEGVKASWHKEVWERAMMTELERTHTMNASVTTEIPADRISTGVKRLFK